MNNLKPPKQTNAWTLQSLQEIFNEPQWTIAHETTNDDIVYHKNKIRIIQFFIERHSKNLDAKISVKFWLLYSN